MVVKSCRIEEQALLKVLLHAAKHPTTAVNGVLLGTATTGGEGAVAVTDAVPVCHSFITLTPVLEVALSQVEQHVKEQQKQQPGLRIVGYYQCNERLSDGELGAGRRVADRIDAACPDSIAAVLDGMALHSAVAAATEQQQQQAAQAAAKEEPPMLQLLFKDGARGWAKLPAGKGAQCPTQGIAARLVQYMGQGTHQQLADFEEHLEDITLDWLNPGLLQGPA